MTMQFDWKNDEHVKIFTELCLNKHEYFNITNEKTRIEKLIELYKFLQNLLHTFNGQSDIIDTFLKIYVYECMEKFSINVEELAKNIVEVNPKMSKKSKQIFKKP